MGSLWERLLTPPPTIVVQHMSNTASASSDSNYSTWFGYLSVIASILEYLYSEQVSNTKYRPW